MQAKPQNSKQEVKKVEPRETISILHTLTIHTKPFPGSWSRPNTILGDQWDEVDVPVDPPSLFPPTQPLRKSNRKGGGFLRLGARAQGRYNPGVRPPKLSTSSSRSCLCEDERGREEGMVGCCKTRKGLEENLGWPHPPATLPHHVCEAPFRPPQGLTRNPAPLATSEAGEGASP